jgi:tetratricopeptide (TPR) repeat protein
LALARALARQGQEGEARDTASDYLRRLPVTLRVEEALRPVARDLDAHEAVLDWKALSGPGLELRSNRELFENTAGALWRFQELSALRTGFEGVVERNPDDAWAHYEYGAVLAELGYFEAALDYALRASELAPKIVGNYFVDDERYDLVRDYQARHFD